MLFPLWLLVGMLVTRLVPHILSKDLVTGLRHRVEPACGHVTRFFVCLLVHLLLLELAAFFSKGCTRLCCTVQ